MANKPQSRSDKTAHIIKYIDTDLLCYRTQTPPALTTLQQERWQPWLDWFAQEYETKLETTSGIAALSQPQSAKDKIEQDISQLDDMAFDGLYGAATICGSVVLGLALLKAKLSPEQTLKLIFLEEDFKETVYDAVKYGTDPHIEKKKKEALESLNHAVALARESAKNAIASKA